MGPLPKILKKMRKRGVGNAFLDDDPENGCEEWSAEDFAGFAGIAPRSYSDWETGKKSPSKRNAFSLKKELEKAPGRKTKDRELLPWEKELISEFWRLIDDFSPPPPPPPIEPEPVAPAAVEPKRAHTPVPNIGIGTAPAALVAVTVIILTVYLEWPSELILLTSAFVTAFVVFDRMLQSRSDRAFLARFMGLQLFATTYRILLDKFLSITDKVLVSPAQSELDFTDPRRAWTLKLYARALIMAALYPMISMLFQWTFTNHDVYFGDHPFVKADANTVVRIGVFLPFALSFFLSCYVIFSPSLKQVRVFGISSVICITIGLIASQLQAMTGQGSQSPYFQFSTGLGGLLLVLTVIAWLRAIDQMVALVIAATVGGTSVAILSGQIVDFSNFATEAISFGDEARVRPTSANEETFRTHWVAWFSGVSAAFNWVVTIGLALVLVPTFRWVERQSYLVAHVVYLIACISAIVALSMSLRSLTSWSHYYLFAGILPLINAIFDFGSIGLTRWALRNGAERVGLRTLAFSLFDLLAALAIFMLLGVFAVTILYIANWIAGTGIDDPDFVNGRVVIQQLPATDPDYQHFIDLTGFDSVFNQIPKNPWSFSWLYFTFLTTLLPTLIHVMIAVWAIGPTVLRAEWRRSLVRGIVRSGDVFADRLTYVCGFALWTAFAVTAPLVSSWWVLTAIFGNSCTLGVDLLEIFQGYANYLTQTSGSVEHRCGS